MLPYRDGVLVTAAPDILFLQDADGDGVAERSRVEWTGFGADSQQLRDGTSNTVVASEQIAARDDRYDPQIGDRLWDIRGLWAYPFIGSFYMHKYTPNASNPDEVRTGSCSPEMNAVSPVRFPHPTLAIPRC